MTDEEKKRIEEVALFRYGVIADFVHLPPGEKGLYRRMEEKAAQEFKIPGSLKNRVAPETIRDWLKAYRKGGFEALAPKIRKDKGVSRALPQEVTDLLVSIKEDNPELSVQLVVKEARLRGKIPDELALAPTTVHRVLSRAGLMRKEDRAGGGNDRRRFAYEKAGELWMSDVMHGPSVTVAGRQKRKTYLIAFLDDATRVIPYAAFALSENTAAFLPVLEQAIERRGCPKRLYVDNGSAYRSHHLSVVCAKLGITLIHARPYDPAAKGKQERWFRTVRMQFLPLLGDGDRASLELLNRRLWSWVESEYHAAPHRGLDGETPLDRWAKCADEVHYLDREGFADLFLAEARRRVAKDRTVSLNGLIYEVEAHLVGATVLLRFSPQAQARGIQVWHEGKKVQDAKVVDVRANCFVRRERNVSSTGEAPAPGLRLSGDERGGR